MKKNKELAPEEKNIYVYPFDDKVFVYGRVGDHCFGDVENLGDSSWGGFWSSLYSNLTDRVINSMSFFEEHGISPDEVEPHKRELRKRKRKRKRKKYPITVVLTSKLEDHERPK